LVTGLAAFLIVWLVMAAFPVTTSAGIKVAVGEGRDMEVFFMIQLWDATTFGANNAEGEKLDTRSDLYIRRGRFGIRGRVRSDVGYFFNFAYDNIGKGEKTAATGIAQATDNRAFYLWDAFCTLALDPTWANLTAGYFRPQVGRESITTAFKVDSFIKSPCNSYPREHIVGRGPGRETGINLGGLHLGSGWSLNYNFGLFDTNHEKIAGDETGGTNWAPLKAGRIALSLGEPEMRRYRLGYRTNYFGRRSGVTVAVNVTCQRRTNQTVADTTGEYVGGFRCNRLFGLDLLANLGRLNLDAEYDVLTRRFDADFVAVCEEVTGREYTDRVWHMRAGFDIPLPRDWYLEPVVMYARFEGDRHSPVWPGGVDEILDIGLNWFLDEHRWKVNLHYVSQCGRAVSKYSPDSDGKQAKGDFLGLGMQVVF